MRNHGNGDNVGRGSDANASNRHGLIPRYALDNLEFSTHELNSNRWSGKVIHDKIIDIIPRHERRGYHGILHIEVENTLIDIVNDDSGEACRYCEQRRRLILISLYI